MNQLKFLVSRTVFSLLFCVVLTSYAEALKNKLEYYELMIYKLIDKSEEPVVEGFLKNAYLPNMHKAGIKNIGLFKPLETDTNVWKNYLCSSSIYLA